MKPAYLTKSILRQYKNDTIWRSYFIFLKVELHIDTNMERIVHSADAAWIARVNEAYKKSRIDGLKGTNDFFEKERGIIENTRAGGSRKIQIVWTLNKKENTGESGFGELCSGLGSNVSIEDPGCPVRSQMTTYETLKKWLNSNCFVRHPTNLCAAFGLNLECYAEPYAFSKEHQGRNNVIATYMTCEPRTGLARNTIIGRAVFVRKDSDGNPVSLTVTEFRRAMAYINDLMDAMAPSITIRSSVESSRMHTHTIVPTERTPCEAMVSKPVGSR